MTHTVSHTMITTVVRSTAFESLFCLGAARTKKTFKRGTSPKFFISSVYFFSRNKKDDVAREHIAKMMKFSSSKVLPLVDSQRGLFYFFKYFLSQIKKESLFVPEKSLF